MEHLDLPGWQIEFDRQATANAYTQIDSGGAETCVCDPCRNWAASRDQILSSEFREFLERLGISPDREVEAYHNCRLESGLHSYGGWYHFVGNVVSGEQEGAAPVRFGAFVVFFRSRPVMLHTAFAGHPVVQLEFAAEVPWLSNITESE